MLKEYLACFNSLALKIKDLNEGIVVYQITVGLWAGHFSLSMVKKPAVSLAKLLAYSEKYINAEEVDITQHQLDCSQSKQPFTKDKQCERLAFTPRGKCNNYKPLWALTSEIIKDIQTVELMQFPLPKKRKFPPTDKSKYCKFHKDYGHDTNDCHVKRRN